MLCVGGGWTLVDNNPAGAVCFQTRHRCSNKDMKLNQGCELPAYTWSDEPQMMVRSSYYSGTRPWITLSAGGETDEASVPHDFAWRAALRERA
jgi:hypothetical protein